MLLCCRGSRDLRMASTKADAFKAFLSVERGGITLPPAVIKHLVKYYIEPLSSLMCRRTDHDLLDSEVIKISLNGALNRYDMPKVDKVRARTLR